MRALTAYSLLLLLLLGNVSCSGMVKPMTTGEKIDQSLMDKIEYGKTTRTDIIAWFGEPYQIVDSEDVKKMPGAVLGYTDESRGLKIGPGKIKPQGEVQETCPTSQVDNDRGVTVCPIGPKPPGEEQSPATGLPKDPAQDEWKHPFYWAPFILVGG